MLCPPTVQCQKLLDWKWDNQKKLRLLDWKWDNQKKIRFYKTSGQSGDFFLNIYADAL